MRITPEEAARRLQSAGNLSNSLVVHKQRPRRGAQTPEFLRDVLGTLAVTEHQGDLARTFGVSDSVVSTAKTGRVGGKPPNEERAAKIQERNESIKDAALQKLMMSLGLITDEKLSDLGPKDLSTFAVNMSKVATTLDGPSQVNNQVQVVFYAPQQKTEEKYKEVEL